MSPQNLRRQKALYILIGINVVILIIVVALAMKLADLLSTNYQGCLISNEARADVRLLLTKEGHPIRAARPALRARPCFELYGGGLRP